MTKFINKIILISKNKQFYKYTFLLLFTLFGVSTCLWQLDFKIWDNSDFYYNQTSDTESTTNLAQVIKSDSIVNNNKQQTLLYKIRQYFRLTWNDTYDQDKPATWYITMIMNMALWLTSFISLILIIFAFYLMFFQKQEEWFAKAKKILIWVAIALVVMWLSWVIVSFFFEIYSTEAVKNI